jgi:hypothetical protein
MLKTFHISNHKAIFYILFINIISSILEYSVSVTNTSEVSLKLIISIIIFLLVVMLHFKSEIYL